MKNRRNGFLSISLLICGAASLALAQDPVPAADPVPPAAAQQQPQQPQPPQQQPPQNPPQNPPAETPQQPEQRQTGIQPLPPPLPKVPDVRQPGEYGWWVELNAGFPSGEPVFDKGRGATFTAETRSVLHGRPKYSEGAEIGIAVGLHNALRFSYFDSRASGTFTNQTALHIWNMDYDAGDLTATKYRLQNGKISFEYLTWPYPVESRRFRLKTLWQVQYTSIRSEFDEPLKPLFDPATGLPLVDASGNPISYNATGSHWFIYPTFGLGVAYFSGRHFRVEANASGFAFPHHSTIWDADGSANLRYGHFEFRVGAKAFHFKTSTNAEYYVRGTQAGAFFGVRWYSTN